MRVARKILKTIEEKNKVLY